MDRVFVANVLKISWKNKISPKHVAAEAETRMIGNEDV
jgi:hypothetical protein